MEAIKFENVQFSYEDKNPEEVFSSENGFSLQGIDFSVQEGEFVAVLGHNGSGKSTLAKLVNGLLSPSAGKITVFGLDAAEEKNLFDIRKQVGIVFQNPDNQMVASIVEDDVAFGPENIAVPSDVIGERIDFALSAVGMQAYRHATPSRLSGGQKQRIAIAGVLALKPRIMILDESTAMLDPQGRKEVMDVVLKLNKEEKITVLLITHFPEEVLLADRAIVVNRGKIVMEGTPKSVFERGEELEKYALTLPKMIKISRALQKGGLPTEDKMTADELAREIGNALNAATVDKITVLKTEKVSKINAEHSLNTDTGRVECKNLAHVYNPSSPFETYALNGVDLEIQAGEFFGILGHTGSGKSTFVQHLNALLKVPTAEKKYKEKRKKAGSEILLKVNGYDLTDKKTDFKTLRSKVGMVFQYPEYQLFAETVYEDVAFGLKNFKQASEEEIKIAVKDALEAVGLDYAEIKDRSPFELSGGQKRRVAIAGVIVTKPEILVLDEPSAGLDPLGKEEIMQLLHNIHKGWCKTVIIVSHDMDEIAENCTSAAVFADGKVLATGAPEVLFTKTDVIKKAGLDVPFTTKVVAGLKAQGIEIACDYTVSDFVEKVLLFAKNKGAGTEVTPKEDVENA